MGKALTMDRNTKSPNGIEISMKDSSNRHGEDLAAKSHLRRSLRMGELFRRERVMGRL
jgi:hypothetical protein